MSAKDKLSHITLTRTLSSVAEESLRQNTSRNTDDDDDDDDDDSTFLKWGASTPRRTKKKHKN